MSIEIQYNNTNQIFQQSFDLYGNFYLHDKNDKINAYQLNISNNNIPYFEYGNYEIIDKKTKINTFKILDENSLKNKVNDDNLLNIDDEDNNNYDYYPEDENLMDNEDSIINEQDLLDEENIKNYGINNLKFDFWNNSFNKDIMIFDRKNGDIMALYDIYIYENNHLIFKSNASDKSSIYRICIYDSEIVFRPIGYPTINYTLKFENNDINFIKKI
jgi:hypothetical protein